MMNEYLLGSLFVSATSTSFANFNRQGVRYAIDKPIRIKYRNNHSTVYVKLIKRQQNPIKIIQNIIIGFLLILSTKFVETSRTIVNIINAMVNAFVNVAEVTKNDQ
jgi:hypothetical protein